jgi:hypothetical protein
MQRRRPGGRPVGVSPAKSNIEGKMPAVREPAGIPEEAEV